MEEYAPDALCQRVRKCTYFQEYGELPWWFSPHPPTPAAGWPKWDQEEAERLARESLRKQLEEDRLAVDGWGPEGNPWMALTDAAKGMDVRALDAAIRRAEQLGCTGKELQAAQARMAHIRGTFAALQAVAQHNQSAA